MFYVVYYLLQFTWGIIANIMGLFMFLKHRKCKHEFFHGAILTYHDEPHWGGVSLGIFIFVCKDGSKGWLEHSKMHEFGHTIQSMILGPLYFLFVAIPSVLWCNTHTLRKVWENRSDLDRDKGPYNQMQRDINYVSKLYCEANADWFGHFFERAPVKGTIPAVPAQSGMKLTCPTYCRKKLGVKGHCIPTHCPYMLSNECPYDGKGKTKGKKTEGENSAKGSNVA